MERRIKDYAVLTLKGMAMGAADVVPGVSGGTIAFIAGIYDELINSIKSINMHSLKLLFTGKIAAFWKAVNGNFLFALLLGIAISVFSLAKLITYLLLNEPVLVWSFFLVWCWLPRGSSPKTSRDGTGNRGRFCGWCCDSILHHGGHSGRNVH